VLFQPMYDAYCRWFAAPAACEIRHAEAAALDLRRGRSRRRFTDRTPSSVHNPLNPTGVVYGREFARNPRPRLRAARRHRALRRGLEHVVFDGLAIRR